MTDEEKHAWCKERTGHPAVFLPERLYDKLEEWGADMRWYVKQKPIPKENRK